MTGDEGDLLEVVTLTRSATAHKLNLFPIYVVVFFPVVIYGYTPCNLWFVKKQKQKQKQTEHTIWDKLLNKICHVVGLTCTEHACKSCFSFLRFWSFFLYQKVTHNSSSICIVLFDTSSDSLNRFFKYITYPLFLKHSSFTLPSIFSIVENRWSWWCCLYQLH